MDTGSDNHNRELKLQLGGPVPDFEAMTTHGEIQLSEWNKGRWVVLFSYPADFTAVCATEFEAVAQMDDVFAERNVALLGCSVDSVYSHIAWVHNIKENFGIDIRFPIIADVNKDVARKFQMIHEASTQLAAVGATFVIDPERNLRAMNYYPLSVGRNFDETLRVIHALQVADKHDVACPANWRPGRKVLLSSPTTTAEAKDHKNAKEYEVTDWYFSKVVV